MAKLRTRQAISAAIRDEMMRDPNVILFGEDVGDAAGVFKTSEGLLEEFGPSRVRDTPISEMGFLGAAVGAAATGLRPIVEIMFVEFLGVALDQVVTEAAKLHYLSGGRYKVPLVIRASSGAGLGFGAQHSQSFENWMFGAPGLKLGVVSSPQTAYGLLRAAVADDNPVVLLEPRILYADRQEVETGDGAILELGKANRLAEGEDVTIVALGSMVKAALSAAEAAPWSADVIDLQSLIPWDRQAVLESVRKTGRLVTVEESPATAGWGTEIVSHVAAETFGELKAPVTRITCPDVPVPFAEDLERRFLPSAEYVAAQVSELVETNRRPSPWWEQEGLA
jgi:pyruvate dehydrogenase E1 component beta subunit